MSHQIQHIFVQGRGVYGSPRVHAILRVAGVRSGRKRVARLMRMQQLAVRPNQHRVRTTDSNHTSHIATNRLNRDFTAPHPNAKWVGDITGVWTRQGWLFLAALVDCYSRMVVGWAMSAQRDEALVTTALHHTDRGSQYTSSGYQALVAAAQMEVSMSRKGNCWDNAVMESFYGTLKSECTDRCDFLMHTEAKTAIFEYLEVFYNRQRLHSSLGYANPTMIEYQSGVH